MPFRLATNSMTLNDLEPAEDVFFATSVNFLRLLRPAEWKSYYWSLIGSRIPVRLVST